MYKDSEAYEKALLGARNSAKARTRIAEEKVINAFENKDGSRVEVRESAIIVRTGRRRVTIPVDLLDYPIVYEFSSYECEVERQLEAVDADESPNYGQDAPCPSASPCKPGGCTAKPNHAAHEYSRGNRHDKSRWDETNTARDLEAQKTIEGLIASIEVKGSMKGIKHRIIRAAKSGTLKDGSGMARKTVIHPREVEWEVRLQYCTDLLESDIRRRNEKRNRFMANGETDLNEIERSSFDENRSFSGKVDGRKISAFMDARADFVEKLEFYDAIDYGISFLEGMDRMIFVAHYLEDLSFSEIAEKLGRSNSTISYRLHTKILPTMRKILSELGYE